MEYRRLGKSGLQVSVLSFGSWVSFSKQINDKVADQLMGIAYDNGVNFFDNAEVYALGESEKMMGRVLAKKKWDRTSYTVSSKAFFGWRGKENKPKNAETRLSFFGVYDGHGGDRVAMFAGENIHKIVAKQEAFKKGDVEQALKDGFLATDRAILNG